jgi:hypothetical protein
VQDLVLNVIGNWKHKTLACEFYDEYFVPRYTTDIVLASADIKRETQKLCRTGSDSPSFKETTNLNFLNRERRD